MNRSVLWTIGWACVLVAYLPALFAADGEEPYRIKGGETLRVIFPVKSGGESYTQLLLADGLLYLPGGSAATVNVLGKSIAQAQEALQAKLSEDVAMKATNVSLQIASLPEQMIYINGEVRNSTALRITPGMRMFLVNALTQAGSVLPTADLSRINIVRKEGIAEARAIVVDASKFGSPGNADLGPQLYAGDVISVPRGEAFFLAGEVPRAGKFTRVDLSLQPKDVARVSRLLYATGGLKPTANPQAIRLLRTVDGNTTVIKVDPSSLVADPKDADGDPVLKDGDTVLVGSVGSVMVSGRVRAPGIYPLPGGALKLSQLIVMAGGFAEFAKSSSVSVFHENDPKASVRVDVDAILKKGESDKDILLQSGDTIYVGEKFL